MIFTYICEMKTANRFLKFKPLLLFGFLMLWCFVGFGQTTDLLISEYGEGSSGNSKFIEIFNGTGSSVDLSNYRLERVTNGGSWPEATLSLSGTLADGNTYVVANNSSDVPNADLYDNFCSWNGDDAVALATSSGVLLDVIGDENTHSDPGNSWPVGSSGSTQDHRLTRKSNICSPNVDASVSLGTTDANSEWNYVSYATGSANTGHVVSCASSPLISLSETTISGLSYEDGTGGPSVEQTFTASGTNLTADITLTAPANFEISSTSGSGFGSSVSLTPSGGVINSTIIYVRLAESLAVNNYSGILTATSTGATQQDINLSGSVFIPSIIFEDFNDGDFTANPIWTGDTPSFSVITDATIPDGNANTDGFYLASNASAGDVSLAVESTENKEWRFSLATPDFDPSDSNYVGVVLLASQSFSGELISADFDGYYLKIGDNGGIDPIELWRKDGLSEFEVGDFPASPNFDPEALQDGLNIRVTRNNTGEFELFYSTGFEYSTTPTTTAGTLTDNTYTTSSYFGVYQNIGSLSATRRVYLDNIELGNPNLDDDTALIQPVSVQIPSSTIQADATTLVTNSVPVLNFNVSDSGTSDGVATQITQLRFIPGTSNTALWSEVIQGIRIERNSFGTPLGQGSQNVSISDTEILVDIAGSPPQMTVTDGVSEEYTISVFLNTTGITDQQVLQFEIESVTTGWDALFSGSQFQDTFTNVIGNTHTIDVVGSNYQFITQPVTSILNQPMGLSVQVAFTDSNENVDTSFSGTVDLSSTGTLSAAIPSQSTVNGVATFPASDIVHTVLGNSLVLEATSTAAGFPSPLTSSTFDIISTPELIVTEVADPGDDASGKYVEIYNAGIDQIDFSISEYHLTREANGGASYESNQLTGVIPAKGYYIISQLSPTDFNNLYGVDSNVDAFILGNGNDSYYLSTSASISDSNVAISTLFDIYGEIGINGFTNDSSNASSNAVSTDDAEWEYEDSRAYRLNPDVKNANSIWTSSEWFVDTDGAMVADMTPGYGDNDYVYVDDTVEWTSIGLGNPIGNSTTNQNIFVRSGNVTLTGDIAVGDLVVRSGATLTLAPDVKLTVSGDIVNEGTIIFDSDATGTAVLEAVQPNTRVVGNGFEVRRYIPVQSGIRAYRYLSLSVTTPSVANNGSIYDNWQQGGLNLGDSGYESGVGTHITGSTDPLNTLGFDPTPSGNPSMFSWDIAGQGWNSISNTNNTTLSVGDAYAILIRGDRTSPLDSNTLTGPSTTLRTTGQIHVGDFLFDSSSLSTTVNDYNFVGNPYQSQVDLVDLILTSSQDVRQDFVYIWDPKLGSLGGYAVLDIDMASISTVIDFGSTTPAASDANQYLQPQQAFFIETSDPNPQINFTEDTKDNDEDQTQVFSDDVPDFSVLDLSLKGNNGLTYDGIRLVYGNAYSNTTDNFDATKLWNNSDNLCIISNASYLSVEKRNTPTNTDVTALGLYNLSLDAYTFEASYYADDTAFSIFLVDHYTNQTTEILPDTTFSYAFTVDPNIPESVATDRFELVYDTSTLSAEQNGVSNTFSVYPNPVTSNTIFVTSNPNEVDNEIRLELFTLDGRLVRQFKANDIENASKIKVNIDESLQNGTYLLHISNGKKTSVEKIIINR